jgi:hypothetical protein
MQSASQHKRIQYEAFYQYMQPIKVGIQSAVTLGLLSLHHSNLLNTNKLLQKQNQFPWSSLLDCKTNIIDSDSIKGDIESSYVLSITYRSSK